jgi:heat shock protein HtpX
MMIHRMWWYGGIGGRRGNGKNNGILLAIGALFLIFGPLFASLIKLAISRRREYLADASGALLTRYPEGLASALEKIAADPRELKSATKGTAHLFFANPFKKGSWSKLFSTHPPIEDRIKILRGMDV